MRCEEELDERLFPFERPSLEGAGAPSFQGKEWVPRLVLALRADDTRVLRGDAWRAGVGLVGTLHFAAHGMPPPTVRAPQKAPEPNAKIAALEARVRKLEAILEQLVAERGAADEEEMADEAVTQPEARWIRANRDQLRAHADSFIALDPDKGILVHSADGDDFAAQLKQLSAEERERVILFHASMYL